MKVMELDSYKKFESYEAVKLFGNLSGQRSSLKV